MLPRALPRHCLLLMRLRYRSLLDAACFRHAVFQDDADAYILRAAMLMAPWLMSMPRRAPRRLLRQRRRPCRATALL